MIFKIREKKIASSRMGLEKWEYEVLADGVRIKMIYSDKRLQESAILERILGLVHRG